jgi:hypothetical protein
MLEEETAGRSATLLQANHPGGTMNRLSVILVAAGSTLVLSAAALHRAPPADARELHLRAEATRLRAHFDSVDKELRARDVSRLNASQRAMRTKLIAWLRDYRNAGTFPENDRFADRAMPFFRDSHGTLCAMAYLVDRSGGGEIVDHIAKTHNNAFIRELTDDRALVAWLDASGLTVDEAARIQPQYNFPPPIFVDVPDEKRVSANYALLSMGVGGASLGTLGFNLFSPSRVSGTAGLTAGVAAIVAGVAHLDESGGNKRVAVANTTLGSLTAIAALHALFTTRAAHPADASKESTRRLVSNASVSPDLMVLGNEPRVGLRLHARF